MLKLALISLIFCLALAEDYIRFHPKAPYQPRAPEWPSKYVIQGTLNLPYAELSEPFTAWFDADLKSSRIDFYGGKSILQFHLTFCYFLKSALKKAKSHNKE